MKTISYLIIVVAITAFSSCDGWNLNLDSTNPIIAVLETQL